MNSLFSLDIPFPRFLLNVLVVSLAGLAPLLAVYIALTPGFGLLLAGGGPAPERFLRQVATNGLPVVFVVNYVAFVLHARLNSRRGPARNARVLVLVDLSARLVAFALLHAVIYVLSADWFGSFGGSRTTALRVVAPTLARAALFENLSGVYLYATLVSALPLYSSAIERAPLLGGLAGRALLRPIAVLLALLLFGVFVLVLTAAAAFVAQLQPSG